MKLKYEIAPGSYHTGVFSEVMKNCLFQRFEKMCNINFKWILYEIYIKHQK